MARKFGGKAYGSHSRSEASSRPTEETSKRICLGGWPGLELDRLDSDGLRQVARRQSGINCSADLRYHSRAASKSLPIPNPYGRAVSDAPPHSGLSPIAVFRHYSPRHLICIVPFFTQRPFASTGIAPLPRYYNLIRLLHSLSLIAVLPSSLAELSGSAAPLAPPRPPCPNRVSKAMLASRPQRR